MQTLPREIELGAQLMQRFGESFDHYSAEAHGLRSAFKARQMVKAFSAMKPKLRRA
ncbi:hypothetical protein RRX38_02010 [Pseudomonas sp. DTU_2021_1001937_2_SI_NGA_ILE_001]|uniref:hypothetical protein n=1 Tax=Pseudomonas sp. DTU_2021_1001937_2_SI_NGA_ILE_001 TaxID=3077589 RepID=UPI0028FC29D7|nr:hypothetical protein [Pseudomonas sp. DTU_2021_1001937_2_SI_NGA_ILE_001]WNW09971.1 hypothetical protein RRX38_02010 [Pseudomonas sp. DTU_2021_1001937_2_SI_NGA_ILE_001]